MAEPTGNMLDRPEAAARALNECASAFIDCTVHAQDAIALTRYVLALEAALRRLNAGVPASDNWQQYAKAGETALACIERHRREQDGLMKLLAHARGEPLPDHEIIALLPAGWTGMLAQVMEFARRIERTRGVLASLNDQQEKPT